MYISDRRLYLTPDGKVSEDPVSGGRLLVPKGGELSNSDAARYGLLPVPDSKARQGLANKGRKAAPAEQPPAEDDAPAEE